MNPISAIGVTSVRYGVLMAAIKKAFSVSALATNAFEARIKNLKRLGFPASVVRTGPGRIDYDLDDIVQLLVAMRLIDAYVPPATAARLATAALPAARILAADGLSVIASGQPSAGSVRSVLTFEPNALGDLGERPARAGRYEAPLGSIALIFLPRLLDRDADAADPVFLDGLVIDGVSFGRALAGVLDAAEIPLRPALAEYATPRLSAEQAFDAAGRPAYIRGALRLLDAALAEKPNDADRIRAAIDLRLLLAPTPAQAAVASSPTRVRAGGQNLDLQQLLLAIARNLDMPGGDIGYEFPQAFNLTEVDERAVAAALRRTLTDELHGLVDRE